APLGVLERGPTVAGIPALRERLERVGRRTAYREGRSLHFEQVASLALALLEDLAPPASGAQPIPEAAQLHRAQRDGPLSVREGEVLRLVAEGLTNKGIGHRLFISANTVSYHVTSIFNKLGVDPRAQAVAVATQRNLL